MPLMPDVLIDVTRLVDRLMQGRQPTGVDRVSLAYVQHYAGRAKGVIRFAGRWIVLSRGDSERLFSMLSAPPEGFAWWVRRLVARYLIVPGQSRRAGTGIVFNTGHSGLETADYGDRLRRHRLKLMSFVHDVIPISHPEYSRAGESDRHTRRLRTMLRESHGIIANSHQTLAEVERYARSAGWSIPPTVVAPLGAGHLPIGAHEPPLAEPYFVLLGTIEPRKNHWLLLHLWRRLAEERGAAMPRLVVIGQVGWECENVLDVLERCDVLKPFVVWRAGCSDAELSTWLRHARALLFPSFVEGYGLPLVESLSSGVPVIASRLPIFQEIAGDVPEYLDPIDGPGWRSCILEYAEPQSRCRAAQLCRMQGFRSPSWKDHFEIVGEFLKGVDVALG